MEFAWGILAVIDFTLMPYSLVIMFLKSVRTSFPISTMTLLGSGYLVSHASSNRFATRSAWAARNACIYIQPVAGSIIVIACKFMLRGSKMITFNEFILWVYII